MLTAPVAMALRSSELASPVVGFVGLIGLTVGGVVTWKLLKPKER